MKTKVMKNDYKKGKAIQRFSREPIEFDDAIRISCEIADRKAAEDRDNPDTLADQLIQSCMQGQTDKTKWLLSKGANPNAIRVYGTPLTQAVMSTTPTELTEILIEAGADPNIQEYTGWGPLFTVASTNDRIEVIQTLVRAGAEIDQLSGQEKWTALMNAASVGSPRSVVELLALGADLSIKSPEGYTAMDLARINNRISCLKVFDKYTEMMRSSVKS